jgi:hypothetical protein
VKFTRYACFADRQIGRLQKQKPEIKQNPLPAAVRFVKP